MKTSTICNNERNQTLWNVGPHPELNSYTINSTSCPYSTAIATPPQPHQQPRLHNCYSRGYDLWYSHCDDLWLSLLLNPIDSLPPPFSLPSWLIKGGAINVSPPRLYHRRCIKEVPVPGRLMTTKYANPVIYLIVVLSSSSQASGADTRYTLTVCTSPT